MRARYPTAPVVVERARVSRGPGGRVVEVTAFFDTRTFDDLWTRVTPKPPA